MMKAIRAEFVEFIPEQLEPGVLYISTPFNVTTHLCCCGCGSVVNASLSPARWSFEYDGVAVSMYPSFGNFSFPCKSHYWIRRGRVVPAKPYTQDEIDEARAWDRQDSNRWHQSGKPPAKR
jgi:hypothetical protein